MLQELEREFHDRPDFLKYHIYLTQWSMGQARQVIATHQDTHDVWTGLESKTQYGRPNFEVDFQSIIDENWGMEGKRHIGVFVCGPKPLAKQLQALCITFNERTTSRNDVEFYLNKENF